MSKQLDVIQEFFASKPGKILPLGSRIMIALTRGNTRLSQQDLLSCTGAGTWAVANECKRLERKKYIKRKKGYDEEEKPIYLYELTKKGEDHCEGEIIHPIASFFAIIR